MAYGLEKGKNTRQGADVTRQWTEMQKKVLDTVLDYGGDLVKAGKAAGMTNPKRDTLVLSKEVIKMAEEYLGQNSLKAAMKITDVMESEEGVVQANEKLKSAQLILDRTNPKTDKVDISGEVKGGVFILPNKAPLDTGESND